MTPLEAEILRVSRAFAETCADCELHRVNEPYPKAKWSAAWTLRRKLASEWEVLARELTARETLPPELRTPSRFAQPQEGGNA